MSAGSDQHRDPVRQVQRVGGRRQQRAEHAERRTHRRQLLRRDAQPVQDVVEPPAGSVGAGHQTGVGGLGGVDRAFAGEPKPQPGAGEAEGGCGGGGLGFDGLQQPVRGAHRGGRHQVIADQALIGRSQRGDELLGRFGQPGVIPGDTGGERLTGRVEQQGGGAVGVQADTADGRGVRGRGRAPLR